MNLAAQQNEYELGLYEGSLRMSRGAYYDYSQPDKFNIEVSVWGYVKFPGRYMIPQGTDIKNLISYAGGISDDSNLDDIRIYRLNADSSQQIMKFNYEDLWWNDDASPNLKLEQIQPEDVLIIPGRRRLYFENYLSLGLSIIGVLVSITTLIVTANR